MKLVFDIEANGLYDTATKVWCISTMPLEGLESSLETFTNEMYVNVAPDIEKGLDRLSEATTLIGHNIINYDLPLLKKLYGWMPNENCKIVDTLVISYVLNPDRQKPSDYLGKGGAHSLECWGYRVGRNKPDHQDWSRFSGDMLRRNKEDVEINRLTYDLLLKEAKGHNWKEAIELEQEFAKIIAEQEHHGVYFNVDKAKEYVKELENKMQAIDDELSRNLPKKVKQRGAPVLAPFTSTGAYSGRYKEDISYCSGPFTRIDFVDFNLGSTQQVKEYLLSNGWEPDAWNYSATSGEKTSPKLEGEFRGVEGDLPKRIKERITYRHRKSQIEGWISNLRNDSRLSAGGFTCGTNTGRMRHTNVVNVPKANSFSRKMFEAGICTENEIGQLIWDMPRQKDFFGTQMRSLFCSPLGDYVIVGHDASGLELRMLAHFMNDEEFTKVLLNDDIHEYNRRAAGLDTRDNAKSFIYALLYGAGDSKIGKVVGGTTGDGRFLRLKFLESLPALDRLLDKVKRASRKGYLRGIDNRKVWMRKDSDGRIMEHKALNTLLQSSGSICVKKSSIILWNDLLPQTNIVAHKVIDMHDESQAEVKKEHAELYGQLAVQSVIDSGKYFNLNIPLDAEYKIGMNWAETH